MKSPKFSKFIEELKVYKKEMNFHLILRDDRSEKLFEIPSSSLQQYNQSLMIKYTLKEPHLINVPFEIGICSNKKQMIMKLEKIYYFKELEIPHLTNPSNNIKIHYKKEEENNNNSNNSQNNNGGQNNNNNRILLTSFIINLHSQQILSALNPKSNLQKSKVEDKDKKHYYGLTGYDMHVCLRSDCDDSLFLERDALSIRITKVESTYQSHISLSFVDFNNLNGKKKAKKKKKKKKAKI